MAMSSWNHSMSAFNELAIIVSLVTSTYLHFSWSCSPQNIPKWMIQWPRFCGPNSAPIDCEWLRFLSNSEVYKFVSWLFGFSGNSKKATSINHYIPLYIIGKQPQCPSGVPLKKNSSQCPNDMPQEQLGPCEKPGGMGRSLGTRQRLSGTLSCKRWLWLLFFGVFFGGWGYPMFGCGIKEHVCFYECQ